MLIKTYGEHWRRDWVNWQKGKSMWGYGKNQKRKANFWGMRGVYALYSGDSLVYIGQVFKQNLGDRLNQHTKGESRDRWDIFSWYGILSVNQSLKLGAVHQREHPTNEEIVEAFESLAIRIADPALNRMRGKFNMSGERAERFHQVPLDDPGKELVREIKNIGKELKRQSKKLEKVWGKVKRHH